jgi:hypothetical protein
MFAGLGQAAGGRYEESCVIPFNLVMALSTEYLNRVLNVEMDSDFLLLWIQGNATSPLYQLRLRLPKGRPLSNVYLNSANIVGTAAFPVVLPVPALYTAGSQIGFDLLETSGAQNTVQLCFVGKRIFL